jgi:crotonobetainyl-CoA:carnitine CoA-transferase CaiB-like acyl-CoA transferase
LKDLPLRDVVVIEFAHTTAGQSAGMFLADLGAEVIRVEPHGGSGTAAWNRNKRSLALDCTRRSAKRVLDALVERADILLTDDESATDAIGLAWEAATEINLRLVWVAIGGITASSGGHAGLFAAYAALAALRERDATGRPQHVRSHAGRAADFLRGAERPDTPFEIDGTAFGARRPAPSPGADGEDILAWCGLTGAEAARLRRSAVVS